MRVGGRLVTSGGHSGFDVAINLWSLFAKELTLVGSFSGTRQDLIHVLDLVAQGAIHPVIYATFPLERVAEAHVAMESRQVFGKILVVPQEGKALESFSKNGRNLADYEMGRDDRGWYERYDCSAN